MTYDAWRCRIGEVADELRASDVRAELAQNRIELALARLWRAMQTPPQAVRTTYEELAQKAIDDAAKARVAELTSEEPAPWAPDLKNGPGVAVLAVAAEIRALDQALLERRDITRSDDPNADFLAFRDESVFILPRVAGSVPQGRRGQAFERRGLIHHRILPCQVGDLAVRLYSPANRGPGMDGGQAAWVSAMFAKVATQIVPQEPTTVFRVGSLSNEAELRVALKAQLAELGMEACLSAVWPELAVPPALLGDLIGWLRARALDDDPPEIGFVLAGSWHVPRAGGFINAAPVLDGVGNPLLDVIKRERFELKPGVLEEISPGEEVPVLVYGDLLIAFGICKDFCERRHATPYPDLDVDFVVVPSFGGENTMKEHVVAAGNLDVVYGARSFVVQQYPVAEDADVWGAVLRPAALPRGKVVAPAAQKKSLHRTHISCVKP